MVKNRRPLRWKIVLVSIVAFLAMVVVAQLLPGQSPTSTPPSTAISSTSPQPDPTGDMPFVRRETDDPMAIGDVDAPVVLTQWTDLRCPFCAVFSRETLPSLIEEYVETGLIRIEFHDVAFFGEQSEDAAVAARAAANQGRFLEFATAIYDAAPEGAHADLPRETLMEFAEQAGVPDIDRFTADLDDPALRHEAKSSTVSAQRLGVNSVPFFVAGNTALAGAQPLATFRQFLDAALETAG